MRKIGFDLISKTISELSLRANFILRKDVLKALRLALKEEKNARAKGILEAIMQNASFAKAENLAICQDTGLPWVLAEVGEDVKIEGDLKRAINKGIEAGYKKGYLRNSIISDPLERHRFGYTPALIHIDFIKGNHLRLTVLPKGFGCENKGKFKCFEPTASLDEIKEFILKTVKEAGPDACPPFVVGVGIGGTADYAMYLAKKALLKKLTPYSSGGKIHYTCKAVVRLEKELWKDINRLNIGPMGLGGNTTCLGVNIETYPTHMAGLPVAVDISCHALRSATAVI